MVNAQINTAGTTGQVNLVQDYLDALLRDVTADAAFYPEPEPQTEPVPEAAVVQPASQSGTAPVDPAAPETVMDVLPEIVPEIAPAAVPETAHQAAQAEEAAIEAPDVDTLMIADAVINARGTRVRPDWASQPFAALLFEVDGMDMAAPLHELGGISRIGGKLQPVMGQAPWFLGLLRWNGRNIRVIDTARFLMPERVTDNQHFENYQSVIVLGDSLWALAVNQAAQSVRLLPEEIRWREGSSTRPWLAGTLLDRLCSMLDIAELTRMLTASEPGEMQPVSGV